ncbi:hypothetical protein BOX15_Mlig007987g1 [Macrostomum lignano]|uniref:Caspase family p20 domain-containing protein n=1 Tax=Macrostomum lignano TaxID=282301 RepID=A0A267FLP5_9PLAT|nr:hypothetical protein BOX15_Mlig007987g1 [Macrostomum lignano]
MNTCWNNSCLSAMLSRWLPAHDEEDLYMYPTGKCKRPFLRDILFHLDNREQQEGNGPMAAGAEGPMAAAAESPMNATVDNDQIASLIYPNKRTPTKPQALIILYFNKSAAPCESLQADCLRLMKLFKFRLGYLVTDIQVDSESQNDLEDRVKSFANQQDHGDSCVLIILSLSNGLLCGHSIINLFSQMSLSKQLKGKPRLFLLNEWQSGAQTGRLADPASPSEAFEILPDTVSSMEDYWGTRNETSKVHPFSGMVFGLASANNETDVDGSDFVRTLCTTFEKFGSTKDVVSMSAIINEELSVSAKALPRWIIQTTKLFFITNTGGLETTSQKVSPNGPQDNACTSERNKAGRTGVALIFTEYLFDAVRNYQTFLEYASFKVHVDRTRGDMKSLRKAFDREKDHFQKDLVVIVVVRHRHSDGDLLRIIGDIGITRSTEARHSTLLIHCEVHDTEESSQRELQVARQVENLPDKFSMACFFGNEEEVKEFLDSLLQDARMSESLNGISVVGRNFQDGRTSQRNFVFKRNDEIPKWATGRVIKWLGNYTIKSSVQRSTTAQDDTVQSEVVVDEFRLSETRKRWHPKLPPAIESTSECVRAPRALIVHNVIFKEKLSARLGSQHDCQRLTESLLRLGYKVSIRSNLNGAEIKHEVKKFSEESDDGRSSVVAFMSHGRLGEVFGSDEEPVGEKDVLQLFSDESGTKDNFQLAIFQCCRVPGQLPDEVSCLAFYPGMIIAHSTLPNDFSLRVKSKGSRFIQSFCTVLDLFPHNDIVTIIPLVNYLMLNSIYQGFSQQPWWFVQSGKRFWPKVQGAGENSQNPSECNNAFDLQELQKIIESDHQD